MSEVETAKALWEQHWAREKKRVVRSVRDDWEAKGIRVFHFDRGDRIEPAVAEELKAGFLQVVDARLQYHAF